MKLQKSKIIK